MQRRLRELMTWSSFARYLLWRGRGEPGTTRIRLHSGEQFWVRPHPASDLAVACELFLAEAYRWPPEIPRCNPKVIVDAGANVGISLVLWGHRFPNARLIAYEPLPAHTEMISRQVELNGWAERTRVVPAAVSGSAGKAYLHPFESRSHLTAATDPHAVEIRTVDLFSDLAGERVDLLKMDIEGGEYAILGDDRFASLNIPIIAMEWHVTETVPDGYAWCRRCLEDHGYRVTDGAFRHAVAGMLWAWKQSDVHV